MMFSCNLIQEHRVDFDLWIWSISYVNCTQRRKSKPIGKIREHHNNINAAILKQCWYRYDAVTRTIWVWTNLLIRKENFSNLNVLKNHARLEVMISQVVCSFLAFWSSAVIAPKSAQFWVSRFDLCCIAWWLPCLVKKRLCLKKNSICAEYYLGKKFGSTYGWQYVYHHHKHRIPVADCF